MKTTREDYTVDVKDLNEIIGCRKVFSGGRTVESHDISSVWTQPPRSSRASSRSLVEIGLTATNVIKFYMSDTNNTNMLMLSSNGFVPERPCI